MPRCGNLPNSKFKKLKIRPTEKSAYILLTSLALFLFTPLSHASGVATNFGRERGVFTEQGELPKSAEVVRVGIEPTEVYAINLADGTWRANFYIWWRWSGDLDPSTTTYFTNNADAAVGQAIKYAYTDSFGKPKPLIQANGEKYQYAYIRMGFIEDFQVKRFPLDAQNLTMKIENDTYASNYLVYVFDTNHLSKEKFIPTNGWISKGIKTSALIHHYTTDFGFLDEGAAFQDYSQLTYSMEIEREKLYFYLKLLFPLVIVLLATLAALLVHQHAAMAPLAIVSTGLLTTLFAQQSYSQDLPPHAPAVLIDKIYIVGLFVILLTFLRVVLRTRNFKRGTSLDPSNLHLFMGTKSDVLYALVFLGFFALAAGFLISK